VPSDILSSTIVLASHTYSSVPTKSRQYDLPTSNTVFFSCAAKSRCAKFEKGKP
jgi:hypothetical protein